MVKKWLQIILVVALAIQGSGCAALIIGGAAGAAGVIWAKGKLQEDLDEPLPKVYKATLAALKKLELPVIESHKDLLSAKIESEFADGKHVLIDIKSLTETSSVISIRVGKLGDEYRSRTILEKIRDQL